MQGTKQQGPIAVILATILTGSPLASLANDDGEIRLQSRKIQHDSAGGLSEVAANARRHLILQFETGRIVEGLEHLKSRGVTILEYVPNNAVSASVPPGIKLDGTPGLKQIETLRIQDKISANLVAKKGMIHVLVETFPDISSMWTRRRVQELGGKFIENPYLARNHALAAVEASQLEKLVANDEVSWIVPASEALVKGDPVYFCPGPMTPVGPLANYATYGEGWDGPGQGTATLKYHFLNDTPDIAGTADRSEVVRAFNVWSQYAQISFTETGSAGLNRSIDIFWAIGDHGDISPFDGPSGVLAHCFYPSPPVSETIAGDLHFDEAETWRIGSDIDVFSVALHEMGHGLGLNHSNNPNAVMYPYYQRWNDLHTDDIAGIRALYASKEPVGGDEFEPDETSAQAKTIVSGSPQSRSIAPASDTDFATFVLTQPSEVTIETSGPNGDTRLWLYDANLAELEYNDDGGVGLFSKIARTEAAGSILPPGTYFVKVDEYGNNDVIENYTLNLTVIPIEGKILIWQSNNVVAAWYMSSNMSVTSAFTLSSNAGGWAVVGTGDLNSDGMMDIVWQSGNLVAVWLMDGLILGDARMITSSAGDWHVAAIGDLNNDSSDDIIWQNGARVAAWLMDSTGSLQDVVTLTTAAGTWKVKGVADINKDGKTDVLWQSDNKVAAWLMNGPNSILGTPILSSNTGGWTIVAQADYDNNGATDIVWRKGPLVAMWLLDGYNNVLSTPMLTRNAGAWKVVGPK